MRTIGERVALLGGLPGELLDVVDFESQMGQIRTDYHGTAVIELTDFNFLFAPRRLEENQLRTSTGGVPSRFLQTENVAVERNGLFQIGHPISSVEKLFDHRPTNCACSPAISNANPRLGMTSVCAPNVIP